MKKSKKYLEALGKVDANKLYSIDDALNLTKEVSFAKFDETVDLAFRLGVDPRHADQMIRGALALPAGTGKTVRVCVITSGDNIKAAEQAGADFVGGDDIVTKIAGGWLDFDRVIASPDMMGVVGRLGKVLGPRGLMPNPKLGTVTPDIAAAVKAAKAGEVQFRVEKAGVVHAGIGKASFDSAKIAENASAFIDAIRKARPSGAKGTYIKKITLSSTMGPGVFIEDSSAA